MSELCTTAIEVDDAARRDLAWIEAEIGLDRRPHDRDGCRRREQLRRSVAMFRPGGDTVVGADEAAEAKAVVQALNGSGPRLSQLVILPYLANHGRVAQVARLGLHQELRGLGFDDDAAARLAATIKRQASKVPRVAYVPLKTSLVTVLRHPLVDGDVERGERLFAAAVGVAGKLPTVPPYARMVQQLLRFLESSDGDVEQAVGRFERWSQSY